jgi:hypothetical protein
MVDADMINRLLLAAIYAGIFLCSGHMGAATPLPRKHEIKLYITAENTEQALQFFKLDEHRAKERTVVFFDTAEQSLAASHLILRAREGSKGRIDSTVKLRAFEDLTELSDAESKIQPEQDWTNEKEPVHSRSMDRESVAKGVLKKVISGEAAASELFSKEQHELVDARMKDFDWEDLRLYGPVEVMVWRKKWMLDGFPEAVTVELWQLKKNGKTLDILEVSAKAKAENDEIAKDLARQFFAATRAAGLGEPGDNTKTRMVLDFYQP